MFGKKKKATKEAPAPEVPDIQVPTEPMQPAHVGMPGFVPDAPQPVQQQPVPAPQPAPTPASVPEVKDWFKVEAAEILADGNFRYVLTTSKPLGEIGGTYDL